MIRCKYCGREADVLGCANCGVYAVEYVPDESEAHLDYEWLDITCVGDRKQRYMHSVTGAIREVEQEPYRLP